MDTSLSHNSQNFNKKLNILELFFQETVNKNFYQKLKFLDATYLYQNIRLIYIRRMF